MGKINHGSAFTGLSRSERNDLKKWGQIQYKNQHSYRGNISALFDRNLAPKTITLIVLRIAICFVQYQLLMLLPLILKEMHLADSFDGE